MHGSIDHPAEVVIAKDDYELYRRTRPGFLQVLAGHLVSKQVLFLGFSFTDPNLAHLFASIRETFKENGPEHYAIVRRPKPGPGSKGRKRFAIDTVRHDLWVEDLQRYGIQSVETDEYEDVDEILRAVELRLARRSVLVSGSFPDTADAADFLQRRKIEDVARGVGRLVAEREKRLVSGFGLVVGSAAIAGVLSVVLKEATPNLETSLLLRPFPQEPPAGVDIKEFQQRYRDAMVRQAGICIFIAGLKDDQYHGKTNRVIADGVMDEFESAKKLRRIVIPVGATGGAAAEIWKIIEKEFKTFSPRIQRKDFDLLNDSNKSPSELVKALDRIIEACEKPPINKRKRM
jgi:hypothetical protein